MTWPHSIWHQKIHLASLAMLILLLPFSIPLSNACLLVLFINAFAYKAFFATRVNRFPVLWALAGLFIWLAIGMIYSADQPAGWLILEKKMSFLILPVGFDGDAHTHPNGIEKTFSTIHCCLYHRHSYLCFHSRL
jgi:hypothetical protein